MINLNIVCVGNLKDKFYINAQEEYVKRLSKFCTLNIVELVECTKTADINVVLKTEAEEVNKHLKGYVVVLDISGKSFTSVEWAKKIESVCVQGSSCITLVIGGSYGLDDSIKQRANLKLSFSTFTFPHRLMRIILLEQMYRAFCILNNITYHK
ncbi:MAG: 23S rRNA (pseudouridine(1915)-N(3))-methyltransferase RlmH [Clostridia bacterium]|nr:23S rRNA (pseudouridine(1915)-N(3))-methyltransferase RlmH [Clostridia bacterium]MDD4276020.1 23S rRNA (pseudouridine(1915)-N(3))-methyltransferase RlmH [Clostridia bacterium]